MQCFDVVTQFDAPQIGKKKNNSFAASISDFFNNGTPYKRKDPTQEQFFEDLVFCITKGYHPLSFIKNI
jgi:hypothetical protein